MKKNISILMLFITGFIFAQNHEPFEITKEWLTLIEELAPSETTVRNVTKKKILVFSKATGFDHWTIPHNIEMLKIIGAKSNSFEVHAAFDIDSFDTDNLKKYDAVVLNNCNPSGPNRNLFSDLMHQNSNLSVEQIIELSKLYESNLMNYVMKGGGLMIMHGGITVQNNSLAFSEMTGGSFDYHPKQQMVHLKEFDKKHPLVKAFKGEGITHFDEPYFFKNAYSDYNFRPLLYIEIDKLQGMREEVEQNVNYAAWIKRYGEGRVFYSSPAHNAQSLEQPELLQFFLDGLQYVVGDLDCDDSPIGK